MHTLSADIQLCACQVCSHFSRTIYVLVGFDGVAETIRAVLKFQSNVANAARFLPTRCATPMTLAPITTSGEIVVLTHVTVVVDRTSKPILHPR